MRRYQVFISSTFRNLKEERDGVVQALLRADYIPVGMEMFGAASVTPWELIIKTIDTSDFYILLIGFQYGSIMTGTDKSFTECEYEYARNNGIPILPFIQDRDAPVPDSKRDKEVKKRKKLEDFIKYVEAQLTCAYWTNSYDLPGSITAALTKAKEAEKRPGWFRSSQTEPESFTGKKAYLLISASNDKSTEKMLKDAKENKEFKKDLDPSSSIATDVVVVEWDFGNELGNDSHRIDKVKDSDIPIIQNLVKDRLDIFGGVDSLRILYAGPSGLAFHLGNIFANSVRSVEIYQHGKDGYIRFGKLYK